MAMVPFLVLVLCLLLPGDVRSQNPGSSPDPMAGFQPTLAFVIAMLSVMFSITFVLLLYAKLCHRPSRVRRGGNQLHDGGFLRSWRRSSGVDKSVVESLPFFRFEFLKGAKGGLECPVCLAKYEDEEILRLLPKCKHAFHVECIDSWLEKHSSCPLCRRRVTADDLLLAPSSRSFQFQSEDSDLYVRREESLDWSSRSGMEDTKEDAALCLAVGPDEGGDGNNLHKFNHEIVVAQPPINGRWSSMSSPDLILLISEMMTDVSSARVESGNGESIFDIRRKRQISEINHPPPFRCPTTAAGSSHSTTDQRSLSDISPYLRVSDTNGRRTSSFGAAGRRTLPLQIETTPVVEPVAGTSTSTSEEPNPRVVNV